MNTTMIEYFGFHTGDQVNSCASDWMHENPMTVIGFAPCCRPSRHPTCAHRTQYEIACRGQSGLIYCEIPEAWEHPDTPPYKRTLARREIAQAFDIPVERLVDAGDLFYGTIHHHDLPPEPRIINAKPIGADTVR